MALVFVGVGFYQYATRDISQNLKLKTINVYAAFFRVNSVFFDPSIYGRFLVIALVADRRADHPGRSLREGIAALAFAAVTWLGLLISFSQSSFSALPSRSSSPPRSSGAGSRCSRSEPCLSSSPVSWRPNRG